MDRLNCDIPLNDTEKKTEAAVPLSSRREFLHAATSSNAAIVSAGFVPASAGASADQAAELVKYEMAGDSRISEERPLSDGRPLAA
jgi:hypothetical protein